LHESKFSCVYPSPYCYSNVLLVVYNINCKNLGKRFCCCGGGGGGRGGGGGASGGIVVAVTVAVGVAV
jgi:hypothetical protein